MSHDTEAAWAASEVAQYFKRNPSSAFHRPPAQKSYSTYAARESRNRWPVADGIIVIQEHRTHNLAFEYKRTDEGLHGTLTAIGQAYAYVHKGFSAAVIAIPAEYPTHSSAGKYVSEVIDSVASKSQVSVFSYEEPDPSKSSPFEGRLTCLRGVQLDRLVGAPSKPGAVRRTETQWAHLREGSSDPDAFYKYLQVAKTLGPIPAEPRPRMPKGLIQAVYALNGASADPVKYLSNATGGAFHDMVWRKFWFEYVLTPRVMQIWKGRQGKTSYAVNDAPTLIIQADGSGPMRWFAKRKDSIKVQLVKDLNSGRTNEARAWKEFAAKVHDRAHSYREDVDSGLADLGMLGDDGRPTGLGYEFVDACERTGDANSGSPKRILGRALLNNGGMGAFLHYVFRLSEEKFAKNSLAFAKYNKARKKISFDSSKYKIWIEGSLAERLRVMRKVSARGGQKRSPLQAELAVLRNFDYVSDFRPGLGLVINWPKVQEDLATSGASTSGP